MWLTRHTNSTYGSEIQGLKGSALFNALIMHFLHVKQQASYSPSSVPPTLALPRHVKSSFPTVKPDHFKSDLLHGPGPLSAQHVHTPLLPRIPTYNAEVLGCLESCDVFLHRNRKICLDFLDSRTKPQGNTVQCCCLSFPCLVNSLIMPIPYPEYQ